MGKFEPHREDWHYRRELEQINSPDNHQLVAHPAKNFPSYQEVLVQKSHR